MTAIKSSARYIWMCPACDKLLAHRAALPPRSEYHHEASWCSTVGRPVKPVRYVRAPLKKRKKA